MESLTWTVQMALGIPEMDREHKAMLENLAHLAALPNAEFGARFFSLIATMESDFRCEEELMEKINFPALQSHREQHARVLSALHHVVPSVKLGEFGTAREAIELLPQWFLFHLSTMDTALVVALDMARMDTQAGSRPVA